MSFGGAMSMSPAEFTISATLSGIEGRLSVIILSRARIKATCVASPINKPV